MRSQRSALTNQMAALQQQMQGLAALQQQMQGLAALQQQIQGLTGQTEALIKSYRIALQKTKNNSSKECMDILKQLEDALDIYIKNKTTYTERDHIKLLQLCNNIAQLIFIVSNLKLEANFNVEKSKFLNLAEKSIQIVDYLEPFYIETHPYPFLDVRVLGLFVYAEVCLAKKDTEKGLRTLSKIFNYINKDKTNKDYYNHLEKYYSLLANFNVLKGDAKNARKAIALAELSSQEISTAFKWSALKDAYVGMAVNALRADNNAEALHWYEASIEYIENIKKKLTPDNQGLIDAYDALLDGYRRMINLCQIKLNDKKAKSLLLKIKNFVEFLSDRAAVECDSTSKTMTLLFSDDSQCNLVLSTLDALNTPYTHQEDRVIFNLDSINFKRFKNKLNSIVDMVKTQVVEVSEQPVAVEERKVEIETLESIKIGKMSDEEAIVEEVVLESVIPIIELVEHSGSGSSSSSDSNSSSSSSPLSSVALTKSQLLKAQQYERHLQNVLARENSKILPSVSGTEKAATPAVIKKEVKWNDPKYSHIQPNLPGYHRIHGLNKKSVGIIADSVAAELPLSIKKIKRVAEDGRSFKGKNSKNRQGFVFFEQDKTLKKHNKNSDYMCKIKIFGDKGQGNVRVLGRKVAEGTKYKDGKPGKKIELYEFDKVEFKSHKG